MHSCKYSNVIVSTSKMAAKDARVSLKFETRQYCPAPHY